MLAPELLVGGVSQFSRNGPVVVSPLCLVNGWELPRERRNPVVDSRGTRGMALGLSVNWAPTVRDLSGAFSLLLTVRYVTDITGKV